jgi:hypothetical protein
LRLLTLAFATLGVFALAFANSLLLLFFLLLVLARLAAVASPGDELPALPGHLSVLARNDVRLEVLVFAL